MHRLAPVLLLVLVSCGGSRTAPRGQRTVSDCERLVRHTVDALANESGAKPNAEQRKEIDAMVAERCADEQTLAWVNDLPDETYACLMRAKVIAEGDKCLAGLEGRPLLDEAPAAAPPAAGAKCAAFSGSTEGVAHLRGFVRDLTSEGVAGATVSAAGPDGTQTAFTDEDGAYAIEDLTPGVYNITAFSGDLQVMAPCITAAGGSDVPVDIVLQ